MKTALSVVVPTYGRVDLLENLLISIQTDANQIDIPIEIILVDDSIEIEYSRIKILATKYDARVLTGVTHVGGKRNLGAKEAIYEYVLFLDSDVMIRGGTLKAHFDSLNSGNEEPIGCLGQVIFVGESTLAWEVVSEMQLTLPFSYPLVSKTVPWGPTANMSFKKEVFFSVGGFDTTLPQYGGEDVDLGLRLTRSSHEIVTNKYAVAEHTIETWSTWKQNFKRLWYFGRADYYLMLRHSDRVFFDFPTFPMLWILQILTSAMIVTIRGIENSLLLLIGLICSVVIYHFTYGLIKKQLESKLWVHLLGPIIFIIMDLAKIWESAKHRKFKLMFCRVKFLDNLISQDWKEIVASAWGLTASALFYFGIVLLYLSRTK